MDRVRALLPSVLAAAIGACGDSRAAHAPPTPLVDQMPPVDPAKTIPGKLLVAGMTCSGCEYNVTTALRLVPGVLEPPERQLVLAREMGLGHVGILRCRGAARASQTAQGEVVGVVGFEPTISCSQSTCVTRLRHTPRRR